MPLAAPRLAAAIGHVLQVLPGPRVSRRTAALALGAMVGASAALAGASQACGFSSALPTARDPAVKLTEPEVTPVPGPVNGEDMEDAEPAFAGKRPTPMKPRRAAEILGWAWQEVTGEPAGAETVAVLWAHWALETGRGRAMVDHNFAGLKGRAPGGTSSLVWTQERDDGGRTRVRARFRAYLTAEEGACDYVRLLRARYKQAFVAADAGDVEVFVRELGEEGYFTEDPVAYGRALQSLVVEYQSEYARVGLASSTARG